MDITIHPCKLQGSVSMIPSKSQAHRLLICAALSDNVTELFCSETNQDIEATVDCLNALGAQITRTNYGYIVLPIQAPPQQAILDCKESGSTLRFLLPLAGALGVETTFCMAGRLPDRPLSPLWEEMERMGCNLTRHTNYSIHCSGQLHAGEYRIDGGVSSQFISGLLFALSILDGKSHITITGTLESAPYVAMTQQALSIFGISTDGYHIVGRHRLHSLGSISVESDWSNAAFFLVATAIGNSVEVTNLNSNSLQGDRRVLDLIPMMDSRCCISAADVPDLIPILSILAAAKKGAIFTDIQRLRLKESDRVASILSMLHAIGGQAVATESTLTVYPSVFTSGIIDSMKDHRIAMAAAIAATIANGPISVLNAECVAKSYPSFWEEYHRLGGHYE